MSSDRLGMAREHSSAPKPDLAYRFTPYQPGEKLRPEAKSAASATEGLAPLWLEFPSARPGGRGALKVEEINAQPRLPLADAGATRPRVVIMSEFPPLDVIPVGAGSEPAKKRSGPEDLQSMVRILICE